eukprot:Gregarina_sp_Poly_1__2505@NODE_167_length_12139_cov_61_777005_g148_i0_p1_GENE_NODE_167_length_12139_cov_61_777005_g148_i0NODE_167_length_12139_cov_61_777005_g148_i0_p1_ORF_typecomplete_len1156_score226_24RNB/PF00773_19/2_4e111OB_Dis3/PF17849_1/2_4e03OB_Dis3/PF17849_1/1_1e16Rrp44_CSD1/PF17216_3/1_1e16CSD2/PF17876_1/0_57CSD2/PF17876_1/4_3e08Rrp44_S1/PF17215_3/2_3e06OB_RNB/PF08206_11/0_17OB_RNB/PF08206_11/2_2e03_NODE_167_length_12139_cov_61_777005_g148_i0856012027
MKRRLSSKETLAVADIINIDEEEDKTYWSQFVTNEDKEREREAAKAAALEEADPIAAILAQLRAGGVSLTPAPGSSMSARLRRTRRGRLRLEAREFYLQDEFPCGVLECSICSENSEPPPEAVKLRNDETIWLLDGPIVAHQADFLWDDPSINNCVILQSTLDEAQAVGRRAYRRLLRLLGYDRPNQERGSRKRLLENQDELPPNRNFILFPNENVAATNVPHITGEKAEERRLKLIVRFAAWFQEHRRQARMPRGENTHMEETDLAGSRVAILTSDTVRQADLLLAGATVDVVPLEDFLESARDMFPQAGEKLQAVPLTDVSEAVSIASNLQLQEVLDAPSSSVEVVTRDSIRHFSAGYPAHLSGPKLGEKIRKNEAFQGVIRTSPSSWRKGTVLVKRTGLPEIEIKVAGRVNMNRAVDGDIVVVELLQQSDTEAIESAVEESTMLAADEPMDLTEKFGRVVGIIKRNWETYCGSIKKEESDEECRFIPANPKYPDIMIRTRQLNELKGQRLVVAIDRWDRRSVLPRGHWIETLGRAGDPDTEAKVILREHQVITREFSVMVLKCLPPSSYSIPPEEIKKRLDLRLKFCFCQKCRFHRNNKTMKLSRPELEELIGTPYLYTKEPDWPKPMHHWNSEKHKPFKQIADQRKSNPALEEYELDATYGGAVCCSIDPDSCVDIDDALSVKFLKNGNYQIGVHIADVTHFVRPETAIDREAAERCTTVYLVNQRTDMLPKLLSADLCSLKSGCDRLSFSVFWEVTRHGEIKHTAFYKTVMHSVAALTYKQAQDMINDNSDNSPLAVRLRVLNNLAKIFKKKRLRRGAVELASTEVKFDFRRDDEKRSDPTGVAAYVHYDTHSLVEEMMLLANMAVAEKIVLSFPDCAVLRRHPPPKTEGLAHLAQVLQSKGFKFKYGTNAQLAESLNKCKIKEDPLFNKMLRSITVQYMNQAVYFCTGEIKDDEKRKHYALASDLYTHFTSPIRRYADILVHRLLAASLNIESLPLSASKPAEMVEHCERLTQRHRNAQFCSRASADYYAYQYFSKRGSVVVNGVIKQVRKNGCYVVVPETGVNGQARLDATDYEFDASNEAYRSIKDRTEVLTVFDHVWVEVVCLDEDYRFNVQYKIVGKLKPEQIKSVAEKVTEGFVVGSGEVPTNF